MTTVGAAGTLGAAGGAAFGGVLILFLVVWVVLLVLVLGGTIFWIFKVVEVAKIPEEQYRVAGTSKTTWLLVVLLLHIIGGLVWQFSERKKVLAAAGAMPPGGYGPGPASYGYGPAGYGYGTPSYGPGPGYGPPPHGGAGYGAPGPGGPVYGAPGYGGPPSSAPRFVTPPPGPAEAGAPDSGPSAGPAGNEPASFDQTQPDPSTTAPEAVADQPVTTDQGEQSGAE